jgi:hypothetical protein
MSAVRLHQVFPRPWNLASLLASARVCDELAPFRTATAAVAPDSSALWPAVLESAAELADRAGLSAGPWPVSDSRPCFGGQQPYVDYYPAVLAKLDALETCGGPAFYAFADHAPLGSDPWLARTELPCVGMAGGLLRFHVHRPVRRHLGKDLRFVPPPAPAVLADLTEKLKGMIARTAKALPAGAFDRKAAFERLRRLTLDFEEARRRARSAGEFNSLWSARLFARLGFRLPMLPLCELLAREELLPEIAETLAVFVRRNALFAESMEEVLRRADLRELHWSLKAPGHVPLAVTDPQSGLRKAMRLERRGPDAWLVTPGADGDGGEAFNLGLGDAGAIEELLRRLAGRWSLDVFVPLFLFRLGVAGIVNGRGSIRYSLMLAHVYARLFGEPHPPNLLASCSPALTGPFAEAVRRAYGGLPPALEGCEPTLIPRLLASDETEVRAEIAASWRDEQSEARS